MRFKMLRHLPVVACILMTSSYANAQGFTFNCSRDTLLPGCNPSQCFTLKAIIPDLHGLSTSYSINPGSTVAGCMPVYVQPDDPAGTPTNLVIDDRYSNVINLSFPFVFYGTTYNSLVVSTNGYVSFDITNATQPSHYQNFGDLPNTQYDRALIMGPYHDLYPGQPTSPTQRIQYQEFGTAPHRRWILSFYRVPLFSCTSLIENTHQIVLYESTGIIDVNIFSKQICFGWQGGKAMVGIQDYNQTQGLTAPQRRMSDPAWGNVGMNESWRFVPNAGPSLFKRVELYDLGGTLISTGTAVSLGNGAMDVTFPNICPGTGGTTPYVIKSVYEKIDDPTVEVFGLDTVNVTRAADQQANLAASTTSCAGASNGTITVTPTNGTGPYTYSLDGAPAVAGPAPYTFTNVSQGQHTVIVTDATGCVSLPITINVDPGPPLNTTVNKTDVLCNGAATGTITVTQPAIGTPVYEYSLDGINWQTNNTFTGLVASTYTVYYREGAGCQGSQPITIGEPPVLSALASSTPVICNGQNNGVITVTVNGGVAPYQYSIDGGGTWQASNIFNVIANNYTVTIRDANGCITTQPIVVTEPAALTANSTNSNATCNGGNDGVITVTANGGNSGYQYSIDGINFQASNIFNVAPGNYTVTVMDSKGCTTTFPAVVLLTNDLTFTPQADPTICEGKSVQLNFVSNGLAYAWTPATALSSATIPNPVANPAVTTQYIVTTTFGRCTANDTVIVNVNAAPIPNAGTDGFICYGQTYTLQASGGTQYAWSPSDYLSNPQIANPVSSAPRDMIYTVSIISDINGCASLITDDMRLDVTPPIKINTFPFDTIAYTGDILQFLAVPSDTDVINFSWIPSIGMNNPGIANPRVTAGAVGEDILYQVIGTTIAGCKGEGYIRLRVYKGPDIYVPTGFTPNGDGRNDRFTPFPVGIKSLKYFRVFNRWGQLVFTTSRLHEGWDGRINGVVQPTGTYVWMAEAITNENKVITKKGTVTLIH